MEDNNPFILLALLSVFSIAGGFVLGNSVRALAARQHIFASIFGLIWSLIFAGVPLAAGAAFFFGTNQGYFFLIQLGLFVLSVCYTSFVQPGSLSPPVELPLAGVIIGGVLTMAGAVLVSSFLRQGNSMALWGGVFLLLAGAGVLIAAAYFVWTKVPEQVEEPAAAQLAREGTPVHHKRRTRKK